MGARNALQFADKFPDKVEKLILEDRGPDDDPKAIQFYEWLFSIVPTPFPTKLAAKTFFMNEFKVLVKGKTANPETLGLYLYSNIIEQQDGTSTWRFKTQSMLDILKEGRLKDRWREFKSLNMPTLVIRGESSKDLSREVFDEMCAVNPAVSGIEISNAGHWVHTDQPEAFIQAIRQFTDLPT
jgi:pimeloyl-ACP methyl ester carboxylesterase